ncbi:MAG: histidine phosphatase family protein [Acetatifactor sp.]|nr:histidine phosphatase family protein [Acetatifactor sp.]
MKSRLQPVSKGHFYYVRHGQTVWNVENKICGATDSPLTEAGRNQAKEVAEKILAEGLHIDEILYSPLSRARDTAMEISKVIGVPARVEVRLVEQDFGKWEGTARNGEAFRLAKQSFATSNEGGESMLKLCQRIYNLMDELKKEPDKVRLLVAHNGIARAVQSYFTDMTNEEFAAFGIRNCEIRRYDFAQEGKQTGREDG